MLARCCCLFLLVLLALPGCSTRHIAHDAAPEKALPPLIQPMEENGVAVLDNDDIMPLLTWLQHDPGPLADWTRVNFAAYQSLRHVSKRAEDKTALLLPDTPELAAILPPSDQPGIPGRVITYGHMARTLERLQQILPSLHRRPELLASEFIWLRSGPDYTFTGYYEPLLKVSPVRTERFRYPLYKRPPELRRTIARRGHYHSRRAIDERGVLRGRGLELAWAESLVDIFILQIQGSGRLLYPDGSRRSILYDGQNRHPYKAIGRLMKEQGLIGDPITMPAIRQWLQAHPAETPDILYMNPSYVFFRLGKKRAEGSFGSMGYVLTPNLSVATDTSVLPSGLTAFMAVMIPDLASGGERPLYGLMFPQDRGGAIHNHRVDIFFGNGAQAEYAAGGLNKQGMVVILLARDHATQRAAY
ncbi:MAG TPA: MltA domain-containing protein [Candidatus Avidesulfovibrio excrementigallinarum]|nr:MltA domain-containing protein [Candidatus Avidesulfovibrio excrementigallinarum]